MRSREELLKALEHTDAGFRHSALNALGEIDEEWVFPYIINMLGDSDWRIRKATVEILVNKPLFREIQPIIDALRDGDNAGRRNAALETLIQIGPSVIDFLIPLIDDKDDDFRKFIVDIIGEIGGSRAVPSLLKFLEDSDDNVCSAAVEYLGKIGDVRAIEPLLQLIDKKNFWLTYTIIVALGNIKNPRIIPHLIKLLPEETLQLPILTALGRLPILKDVEFIIPFLKHPSINLRNIALKSVIQIGETAASAFYIDKKSKDFVPKLLRQNGDTEWDDFLLDCLRASDFDLKRAAIISLGWQKTLKSQEMLLKLLADERLSNESWMSLYSMRPEIIPFLIDNLENEDERIRVSLSQILGEIGDISAEKSLIKRLTDDVGHVRSSAAKALKKLNSRNAVPYLVKMLNDKYDDVREVAVNTLVSLEYPEIINEVIHLINDKNILIREAAVKVYCKLSGEEQFEKLLFLLKSESPIIRKEVVKKLKDFPIEVAVEPILLALTDEHPDVRIAASYSLAEFTTSTVFEGLVRALNDDNIWVVTAVINSLGRIRNPKSIPYLLSMLEDPRLVIQIAAINSLSFYPEQHVVSIISEKLKEPKSDLEVRRTAALVLGKLSFPSVIPLLLEALNDKDWNFRYSVIEALSYFCDERLNKPLLDILMDTEESALIRYAAIKALANNHNSVVVKYLIKILLDNQEKVVEEAFVVLKKIRKSYKKLLIQEHKDKKNYYNWLLDYLIEYLEE